ncbi:MAG: adenine nucleotide alpha hydrolase [Flavobacteriales bacterium]|nr:adenine nucleotide alpha hydrolase [Flavobacteriales bacterium]
MRKTYFNWSTGKDSALALKYLREREDLKVDRLITTINSVHDRVTMHGLRRELMLRQVEAIGLPLETIELPESPSMEDYDALMTKTVEGLMSAGYTDCGFGDIFLEDLRNYRESQLQGIQCHFPLWKKDTTELLHEFIDSGFKAVVICLNGELLDESFVGRSLDKDFLNDLPESVDPCGENGEFHTFCYDGPIFSHPVSFEQGDCVLRKYPKPGGGVDEYTGYWFLDLK